MQVVEGIPEDISAGQVVWAPRMTTRSSCPAEKSILVFVGWTSYASNFNSPRKLGMVYCQNRPCHLYTVEAPVPGRYTNFFLLVFLKSYMFCRAIYLTC